MGLLDEAIREHLELKRLRGADPSVVAREAREALDAAATESAADARHATEERGYSEEGGQGPAEGSLRKPNAQETAELDMRAMLEEELDISTGSASENGRFSVRGRGQDWDEDVEESWLDGEIERDVPASPRAHEDS